MNYRNKLNEVLKNPPEKLFDSLSLDIKEAPCKDCKYFRPRYTTDTLGDINGVRLCIAPAMYSDFSCFRLKEDKK